MPDLVLSEREQSVLRRLLATDPVPGTAIPPTYVFELVDQLVPCDGMGAVLADNAGPTLDLLLLPQCLYESVVDVVDDTGPLYVGLMHWSRVREQAEACGTLPWPGGDGVSIGFRNGPDAVAQVFLDRTKRMFTERDLAMLALLTPVFQRQLRQRPTARLPASLTVQERRVLMEVAAGCTNAEIAEILCVAPSTVRKHLEHAYRKLGVTGRLAAVVALRGRPLVDEDAADRITRVG